VVRKPLDPGDWPFGPSVAGTIEVPEGTTYVLNHHVELLDGAQIVGTGTISLTPTGGFVAAGDDVSVGAVTIEGADLGSDLFEMQAFVDAAANHTGWTFAGTRFVGVALDCSELGRQSADGALISTGTGIVGPQIVDTEHTGYSGANALRIAGGDGALVDGAHVHHNGTDQNIGEGIKISNGATNTIVRNVLSEYNTRDGIDIYDSIGTIVEDSTSQHNGVYGIETKQSTTDTTFIPGGHIIRRNTVHANESGIHATGDGNVVEDNIVTGHISAGVLSHGIRVGSMVDGTTVPTTGAIVRRNTVTGGAGTGILLGNATSGVSITNNTATGNLINIATNTLTVGATITGNVATPASPANSANELRIGGTGNTVSGNTGTVTNII
jgi:hypothetical protein